MANDDLRDELASVAASLRAYLEWQQATGAVGIPRRGPGAPTFAPADPPTAPPVAFRPGAPTFMPADPPSSPPAAPPKPKGAAPTSPSDDPPKANELPASVREHRPLPIIEEEVRTCVRCDLSKSRTHTAFSRGNPEAKLCFVGEAPGADEDAQGIPFVGRAGQLLDRMITAMGLDPERDTYICNIIKCRPPNNRRPEPSEIEACIPYLHEQLAIVNPKVIVALGNTAVAALLQSKLGITKVRGSWKLYRGRVPVMPTYHPSYLLRPSAQQAEAKRQAWEDLQEVMRELGLPRKKG